MWAEVLRPCMMLAAEMYLSLSAVPPITVLATYAGATDVQELHVHAKDKCMHATAECKCY